MLYLTWIHADRSREFALQLDARGKSEGKACLQGFVQPRLLLGKALFSKGVRWTRSFYFNVAAKIASERESTPSGAKIVR